MNETIIHTQEEMDKVPLDTKDKIIIKDTKEEIIFNTNEDIIMEIEMMSYMKYNDQIAKANDYLGEFYSYQDIEDMKNAQINYEKELSYKAIRQLQQELSKANDKLKKIEEYVSEKLNYIDNAEDQEIILKIIKGDEEE